MLYFYMEEYKLAGERALRSLAYEVLLRSVNAPLLLDHRNKLVFKRTKDSCVNEIVGINSIM